ncbi:C39 family peptidase [Desulfurivibrio sp. D14AmB]|uniref:C39 family peptidase n=1 Tax=Desulfurivibrio sp. D14AmB TaxID=3374370 RepID=UPI00376EC107
MQNRLSFNIQAQPDDATCGPTCLQAVYRYYDDDISLQRVIEEVHILEGGGTLEVLLACHALRRGYRAAIYTYNLRVFDPSWFEPERADLAEKLGRQLKVKKKPKLTVATRAYLEYLQLGGEIRFRDLNGSLLRHYLKQGKPILCGLSATYLYHCPREHQPRPDHPAMEYDDIAGSPAGHFVVLCGYDRSNRQVRVADPLRQNPLGAGGHYYEVGLDRLVGAILLGITTYDANLLILTKP